MRKGTKRQPVLFKLRKKFIALNMVCVMAVIAISFTAIYIFRLEAGRRRGSASHRQFLDNAIDQHERREIHNDRPPKHEFGGNWASATDASVQNSEERTAERVRCRRWRRCPIER